METTPRHTLSQRMQIWIEGTLLGRYAPLEKPGWLLKHLFKIPIPLYRAGLGGWVGKVFLMISTTGRVSGKTRYTVLEFIPCPRTGHPIIMSGWANRSDWVRNLRANPSCGLWMGGNLRGSPTRAEALSEEEVADVIEIFLRNAPQMATIFERWSGHQLDGSREALLATAPYFPCFRLVPAGISRAKEAA